jgi:hypothetical protein
MAQSQPGGPRGAADSQLWQMVERPTRRQPPQDYLRQEGTTARPDVNYWRGGRRPPLLTETDVKMECCALWPISGRKPDRERYMEPSRPTVNIYIAKILPPEKYAIPTHQLYPLHVHRIVPGSGGPDIGTVHYRVWIRNWLRGAPFPQCNCSSLLLYSLNTNNSIGN